MLVDLTPVGRQLVDELSERYGVSDDAVLALLRAVIAGHGSMAQFNHPDLGGMGQWSAGGMVMVGDMFNHGLKARVDAMCSEIARRLQGAVPLVEPRGEPVRPAGGSQSSQGGGRWWPGELGEPAATGAQNQMRYAFFPAARRLVIERDGETSVHDTLDHMIGGFGQQQGGGEHLTFTSQHGPVRLADLPLVQLNEPPKPPRATASSAEPPPAGPVTPAPASPAHPTAAANLRAETLSSLERLGDLRAKGHLSEDEFELLKKELLRRL